MSPLAAIIPALIAILLTVAVRRRWIPGAFGRALASVIALLAVIVVMGLFIRLQGD